MVDRQPCAGLRLAMFLAALVFFSACSGLNDDVIANEWTLVAMSPDGTTLLLTTEFGGVASNCSRFEGFEHEVSANEVAVTANLWVNRGADGCTDDGASESLLLELADPLGARTLLGCQRDECSELGSNGSVAVAQPFVGEQRVAFVGQEQTEIVDLVTGDAIGTVPVLSLIHI